MGTVTYSKNNKNGFDIYCKNISQKDEYLTIKIYRDSEYKEFGAGKSKVIKASKKYSYLLGAECSHAITYLKSLDYFGLQKCKF